MRVKTRNNLFALGVFAAAVTGFAYPFIYLKHFAPDAMKPSIEGNIPPGHSVRGAFLNSGSRDIGPDPDAHATVAAGQNPVKS